ncbi:MAG: hypothetical protein CMM50_05030 [Rhodospirillaceae bacterium]|nr:hypothetical protein [Rhodospirillaceae bacterium]|tara:strand:- start:932 stop:1798 length:867 start_codon:yes stop_codon:yes gene_type:complete
MKIRRIPHISLGVAACAVAALAVGGQAAAQERGEFPYHDPVSRYQNPSTGDTGYYLGDRRDGAYDRRDSGVYDQARSYRNPYDTGYPDVTYRDNYAYRGESGRRMQDPAGPYDRNLGWNGRYDQSMNQPYGRGGGYDRYGQMDVDRDGMIDSNEASYWANAHFEMMDTDGDGQISENEFRRADRRLSDTFHRGSQDDYEQERARTGERFSTYDGADNDGIITRREFMSQARSDFDGFDSDKDGEVSVWDYRSGNPSDNMSGRSTSGVRTAPSNKSGADTGSNPGADQS